MIEIDNREHQLIHLLQQHDTGEQKHLTVSTLQIGDIILCNKVIIERKSVADLYSSILDGRYEEQSYRLGNLGPLQHNHNIIYLIEGDINRHKQKNMLMSAIFSISYYKGFSVMRTFNIQETADFIWNTFKKMTKEKNKRGFYEMSEGDLSRTKEKEEEEEEEMDTDSPTSATTQATTTSSPSTQKDYVSVVKKCKKENITENNIDEIMLCQIPGISTQSAIAIVKHLGGIPQLLQRHAEEGDAIFSGIKVANSTTGKETKLNKTIVHNIKRFLLKTEEAST
jgi:ERCC4-type nuclease